MLKKVVLGIAIAAMAAVIIAYFVKPGSLLLSDNVLTGETQSTQEDKKDSVKEDDKLSTDQGTIPASDRFGEGEEKIPAENYVDIEESVVTREIQYKVNSCRVTKEKGNFMIEPYMKWSDEQQVDENGNMVGAYSYIIADVTIQNLSAMPQSVYLMNIGLQIRDQQGKSKYKRSGLRAELRTFTGLDSGKGQSAPTYELDPGATYEGELVYTETDEMLKDSKLELVVKPSGIYGYNEDTRCIRMN